MGETLFGDDGEEPEGDDEIVVEAEVADADGEDGEDNLPAAEEGGIVKPVEDIDEVVGVYEQFEEIKSELLDMSNDVTKISGNNHINKSGWRKIATAFNLSVESIDTRRVVEDGIVKYIVMSRAVAPNGRTSTATGMCASNESNHMEALDEGSISEDEIEKRDDVFVIDGKPRRIKDVKAVNEHNIMATAETRARNRAISELVGGGEVSAEEMKEAMLGE